MYRDVKRGQTKVQTRAARASGVCRACEGGVIGLRASIGRVRAVAARAARVTVVRLFSPNGNALFEKGKARLFVLAKVVY